MKATDTGVELTAYQNRYDPEAKTLALRQSSIQAFLDCRRKFHLEMVLGLEPDYPNRQRPWSTSTTGSAVHAGIEAMYSDEDPVAAVQAFAHEAHPGWEKDEKAAKGVRLACVMVEGHVLDLAASGDDLGEETIAVEVDLEATVEVEGWQVTVTGQVDRLLRDRDGMLVIEDTKTTDQIASTLSYIQQLGRYAVLLRSSTGQRADRVRSNQIKRVLRTKGGPFYARPWVPLNEDAYDSHWASLHDTLADMLRCYEEDRWYERVSKDCSWKCRVQDICVAMQHGDEIETLVELFYREKGNTHG